MTISVRADIKTFIFFSLNPHLELRGRTDERAFTHRSDKGQPRKMPFLHSIYIKVVKTAEQEVAAAADANCKGST